MQSDSDSKITNILFWLIILLALTGGAALVGLGLGLVELSL